MKRLTTMIIGGFLVATAGQSHAELCPDSAGPMSAVENFGTAMRDARFHDAFGFITVNMTNGESQKKWAKLQKRWFAIGKVKMEPPDVRAAHVKDSEADPNCEKIAIVPHVLRASDLLNNQGSTEFELYIVVNDNGTWKVDEQTIVWQEPDIHEWFPNDEIPEFKGTLKPEESYDDGF